VPSLPLISVAKCGERGASLINLFFPYGLVIKVSTGEINSRSKVSCSVRCATSFWTNKYSAEARSRSSRLGDTKVGLSMVILDSP